MFEQYLDYPRGTSLEEVRRHVRKIYDSSLNNTSLKKNVNDYAVKWQLLVIDIENNKSVMNVTAERAKRHRELNEQEDSEIGRRFIAATNSSQSRRKKKTTKNDTMGTGRDKPATDTTQEQEQESSSNLDHPRPSWSSDIKLSSRTPYTEQRDSPKHRGLFLRVGLRVSRVQLGPTSDQLGVVDDDNYHTTAEEIESNIDRQREEECVFLENGYPALGTTKGIDIGLEPEGGADEDRRLAVEFHQYKKAVADELPDKPVQNIKEHDLIQSFDHLLVQVPIV
ncbi:hypothetical protein BDC45DRAFT_572064 [Circinella umbellata]|nr:hypothetical protein BDC45DRAFT_572064 [Circinella umbellata]